MSSTPGSSDCKCPPLVLQQSSDDYKYPPLVLQQSYSTSITDVTSTATCTIPNGQLEHKTLQKHGYKKIQKLHNTLQGELIKAVTIKNNKYVAIKKINKILHQSQITKDSNNICVLIEENIIKETLILQVLTKLKVPVLDYCCKYIEFFHDDCNYYLVMEYIAGNMNLRKFVNIAHQYIKSGQLSHKAWKVTVKYIHWQLSVCIHWLNLNMDCCHLDLTMDNILITNSNFIRHNNGSISINKNIGVKVCDWGLSEIFKSGKNLQCDKYSIIGDYQLKSPQVYLEEIYNGKLSDVWSLGIILFQMLVGHNPYKEADAVKDLGYRSIITKQIGLFLKKTNLWSFVNGKIVSLLTGMLSYDESTRFTTTNVLQHQWYKSYYDRYNKQFNLDKINPVYKQRMLKSKSFPYLYHVV